jgi:hypothetical protein
MLEATATPIKSVAPTAAIMAMCDTLGRIASSGSLKRTHLFTSVLRDDCVFAFVTVAARSFPLSPGSAVCLLMPGFGNRWPARGVGEVRGNATMHDQNVISSVSKRHRAEDDLFHFDRRITGPESEWDRGLFSAKTSAQRWVRGFRPRWLINGTQPLLRPRHSD